MVSVFSLWLPILVAAIVVFVASFLAWMVLPHHKADFKGVKNEDEFLGALRSRKLESGQYAFPYCQDYSKMKDPDFKARFEAGPHGMLIMWPGPPNMGKALAVTFAFYILVGIFVGYLASFAVGSGAEFMHVFRVTGTAAIMAYTLGFIPNAIWFGRTVRSILMDVADNVVYGILTGLTFALLWPGADSAMPAMPGT